MKKADKRLAQSYPPPHRAKQSHSQALARYYVNMNGYAFTCEEDDGDYLLLPDATVEIPADELIPGMTVKCYDDQWRTVKTIREL